MTRNQTPQQLSIFEEVKESGLPIKPVRTERDFGASERRALSATAIQSRIKQFVRQEQEATSSAADIDQSNNTHSTAELKSVAGPKIERLLDLPKFAPLFFTTTFSPIQEWEGYVREIGPESIAVDFLSRSMAAVADQAGARARDRLRRFLCDGIRNRGEPFWRPYHAGLLSQR